MYKLIMDLIPNDCKHVAALLETSQIKGPRKVKDFQKTF